VTKVTVSIKGVERSRYVEYEPPIINVRDLVTLAREIVPYLSEHCIIFDSHTSGNLCYLGYYVPDYYRPVEYMTKCGKVVKGQFKVD